MNIRPTQNSNYELVRAGLGLNLARLVAAQEQISSGRKLNRPSDDPVAMAAVLTLKRQLGDISRFQDGIKSARPLIEAGMSALNDASDIMSEARALGVEGMNGTLNDSDRRTLAQSLRLLKARLVELGNAQFGDRYLFAGAATGSQPFSEVQQNGQTRVVYSGDGAAPSVAMGPSLNLATGVSGEEAFGRFEASGVGFVGVTGVASGSSANQGTGYGYVTVRHDATSGTPGSGVVLAGGADDTLIGDRTLTIDSVAGTVRLGNGTALAIPGVGSANLTDFSVTDEHGAVVHLDFSGYTAVSSTATLSGAGSISIDGTNFTALDLNATDLELSDTNTGTVLHVDATGIVRADTDLFSFGGAVNSFDVLQGMIDDLENTQGLDATRLAERLSSRLSEFDRNFDNLQGANGALGSRSQRMDSSDEQLGTVGLSLQGLVSDREDVDLASVILDLNKAEQTLQVAQATGARLLQNTLLNYLS